jgi:hypothetical protein
VNEYSDSQQLVEKLQYIQIIRYYVVLHYGEYARGYNLQTLELFRHLCKYLNEHSYFCQIDSATAQVIIVEEDSRRTLCKAQSTYLAVHSQIYLGVIRLEQ